MTDGTIGPIAVTSGGQAPSSPSDAAAVPVGPRQRRRDDLLRTERTMFAVRWAALVFGLSQIFLYDTMAYPAGYRELALAIISVLPLVNLAAWLRLRRIGPDASLAQARTLAVTTVACDVLVAAGLVWAYVFDPVSAHWAILFVVPLLGAARFELTGALATWGAVTALYLARQAFAEAQGFDDDGFTVSSITFRMGLVLLVALVAGLLARDLGRQREKTAAALTDLARVDELRSRLVDGLAHDIRSPLTVITGALALVRRTDNLSDDQRLYLDMASKQTGRLQRLATGMLDLARLDKGRLVLDLQPLPLAPVVETAVDALGAVREDVRIEVDDAVEVVADADRLEQIVVNLVGNALAHGRPPVLVAAERAGDEIALRVTDRGSGVPAEHQDHLFEAFLSPAKAGSIGLGLWLVRSLVEAHGGRVAYRDGPGGGAVFEVVLRAATAAAPAPTGRGS